MGPLAPTTSITCRNHKRISALSADRILDSALAPGEKDQSQRERRRDSRGTRRGIHRGQVLPLALFVFSFQKYLPELLNLKG